MPEAAEGINTVCIAISKSFTDALMARIDE